MIFTIASRRDVMTAGGHARRAISAPVQVINSKSGIPLLDQGRNVGRELVAAAVPTPRHRAVPALTCGSGGHGIGEAHLTWPAIVSAGRAGVLLLGTCTMSICVLAFSGSPEMRVEALPEPKLILPGWLPAQRHELLCRRRLDLGIHDHEHRRAADQRHGLEVLDWVVGQGLHHGDVRRRRGVGADEDRLAVRPGLGRDLGGDGAVGAWLVLDHGGNAEDAVQPLGDVARRLVGSRSGAERHDDAERAVGEVVGAG